MCQKIKKERGLKVMQCKSYVVKRAIQLFLVLRALPHLTILSITHNVMYWMVTI